MKKVILIAIFLAVFCLVLLEFILPSLQPNNGRLSVTNQGSDAKVYLDGRYLGNTPLYRDNLKVGQHNLEIEPAKNSDFRWKTTTFLNSSTLSILDLELAPNQIFSAGENLYFKPGISSVAILTQPERSSLKIDGKKIGQAPQTLSLSPGVHLLVVEKAGYITREITLNLETGYKLSTLVYLSANPFEKVLKIDSSSKASLFHVTNSSLDLTKSYSDWFNGIKHIQTSFSETETRFDALIAETGKVYVVDEIDWKNKQSTKSVVNIGYLTKNQSDKLSERASTEWLKIKADFN